MAEILLEMSISPRAREGSASKIVLACRFSCRKSRSCAPATGTRLIAPRASTIGKSAPDLLMLPPSSAVRLGLSASDCRPEPVDHPGSRVAIVVAVLITNRQVSDQPKIGPDAAHRTTTAIASRKVADIEHSSWTTETHCCARPHGHIDPAMARQLMRNLERYVGVRKSQGRNVSRRRSRSSRPRPRAISARSSCPRRLRS